MMPVRRYVREEGWELPASLDALIPPNDPVRFIAGFIDGLTAEDWRRLGIGLEGASHGAARYHPRLLVGVWLWGFMGGIRSSRRLEDACRRRIDFLWLTGWQTPDHNTLWRFYQANRSGMRHLLRHTVELAVRLDLVDLAIQAVDGTKVSGNAARDRSYDQAGWERLLARTDEAIAELEAQNHTDDDPPPPRMPGDLADAKALRERIVAAQAQLTQQSQVNLTDADARLLPTRHGWVAGYNCQAVSSPLQPERAGCSGQFITAGQATTAANDKEQLIPMIEGAAQNTGQVAAVTVADSGYTSTPALVTADARAYQVIVPIDAPATAQQEYHQTRFRYDAATDTFACPEDQTLTFRGMRHRTDRETTRAYAVGAAVCRACPAFGRCTKDAHKGRLLEIPESVHLLRLQRARLATPEAKALYARRKSLAEPVFGVMKEQQGLRRFLLRGKEAVNAEWQLLCACFNLRVLARIWQQRPQLFAV